ncbi:hypothetical protein ACFL7M_15335 [Thermodesulfobacteriota bacterium]
MKKFIIILFVVASVSFAFSPVYAGDGPGPAPNSGDCIPDGPGEGWPPSPGPKANK